jgi:hypothetical protein
MSAKTECSDSEDLSLKSLVTTKLGSGSYSCGFTSIENTVDHGDTTTMANSGRQEALIKTALINSNMRNDRRGTLVVSDMNIDDDDDDCSSESEEYSRRLYT